MGLPNEPLTLSVAQIKDLNARLAAMRHDINNHLSMIMAASELIRMKPEMAAKMADKLLTQPEKVTALIRGFSDEFERTMGITRP